MTQYRAFKIKNYGATFRNRTASNGQRQHKTHNRQISMPSAGLEPTVSAGERPQTYALDRAATGIGFREIL
jgi:hypothetical protein